MVKFQYNNQATYEHNFNRWFVLNCEERDGFGLKPYPPKEARQVFDDIYSNKISHSFRVNKKGILEDVLVAEQ